MSVYKLKKEDIEASHNEFNKTYYGRRARAISKVPIMLSGICFFLGIMFMIVDVITDFLNIEKVELISSGFIFLIFGLSAINFSLGCITQLQYSKMLKDYIESKK